MKKLYTIELLKKDGKPYASRRFAYYDWWRPGHGWNWSTTPTDIYTNDREPKSYMKTVARSIGTGKVRIVTVVVSNETIAMGTYR